MTPSEIADWLDGTEVWDEKTKSFLPSSDYTQAAATIRAQAEALKIATEALEVIKVSTCEAITKHDATKALDRIKGG